MGLWQNKMDEVMRDKILEIVSKYPKRYSQVIQRDIELNNWVTSNSLVTEGTYAERVYSALYQENVRCEHGNLKKFSNFRSGYRYCGHANQCECNRIFSAQKTSDAKSKYTRTQKDKINNQRSETMIQMYGVPYNLQRAEVIQKLQKPKIADEIYTQLSDKDWLEEQYVNQKRSLVDIADELGVYYGTVGFYCRRHGFEIRQRSRYSLVEQKLAEWIESLGIRVVSGDWSQLDNFELDIFLPDQNIAVEVNGLYWHSNTRNEENPSRHLAKKIRCQELGIDLIHVTDYELNYHLSKVQALIKSRLGLNQRIYARKCEIRKVDTKTANIFLENHFQGSIPASIKLGLFYENELVQLITLGKPRFNKDYQLELLRSCVKPNVTVVGGLSRLMAQIDSSVISYCDYDKYNGSGYLAAGFKEIKSTGPGYFWTCGNTRISRYKAQKAQLKKWHPAYDPALTETEMMFQAGYRRFWTCGQLVFIRA